MALFCPFLCLNNIPLYMCVYIYIYTHTYISGLLWIAQLKESACNAGDPSLIPESGRSAGEGISYPLQYSWISQVASLVKNLPAMVGDLGSVPGLGRFPGEGNGYPLQYYTHTHTHTYIYIYIHLSFWVMIFFRYMPRSGIAGSYGSTIFSFFKKPPYCSP